MLKKICLFLLLVFSMTIFGQEKSKEIGWYLVKAKDSTTQYLNFNDDFSIENNLITIDYVKKIKLIKSKTRPFKQIQLEFNDLGSQIWETETSNHTGKQICFIYNNQVITIVGISTKISSGKVSFETENPNYNLEQLFDLLKVIVEKK